MIFKERTEEKTCSGKICSTIVQQDSSTQYTSSTVYNEVVQKSKVQYNTALHYFIKVIYNLPDDKQHIYVLIISLMQEPFYMKSNKHSFGFSGVFPAFSAGKIFF